MMKECRGIVYLLLLVMMMSSVLGLGVGPVKVYKVFGPGDSAEATLKIFNNEKINVTVRAFARGGLVEHITFEKTEFFMPDDQYSTDLSYTIDFPENLAPGAHYTDIVIRERSDAVGMVVAEQSHISKLRVQVPYQFSYAEGVLDINVNNNNVLFNVNVYNFGIEKIVTYAEIKIYSGNDFVKELVTGKKNIASMNEDTLSSRTDLPDGVYKAVVTVHYGPKSFGLDEVFQVGLKFINIQKITVDSFKPGDVAKISMDLINTWPDVIDDVQGEIQIVKDNKLIDTAYSETFEIDRKKELVMYWNTNGREYGTYQAKAILKYGDDVTTKDFTIKIEERFIDDRPSVLLVGIILILLAILIYLIYRLYRKTI